jgi:saccharopine dehydrogenase-like NADP-dependent oxidoreductase
VLVLAATGPVGSRAVRLLAGEGAIVRAASRSLDRSEAVCARVREKRTDAQASAWQTSNDDELAKALDGASVVIAAGAAGAMLLPAGVRSGAKALKVAIDLNAVPPLGIEGVKAHDRAAERDSAICYGALGVGATKMKIHKEAIRRLFTKNDLVLDAAEVLQIGKGLE